MAILTQNHDEIAAALEQLEWGVCANAGWHSREKKPRWAHVQDATGFGKTRCQRLCRRRGFDPDETVGAATRGEKGGE